jgi:integrase
MFQTVESRGRAIRHSMGMGRVELPRLRVSHRYSAHVPSPVQRDWPSPHNPHTFRWTFACLLRKAGVDTMTIKDLGRWESLEMVQRYTRSVTFEGSLKFYKAPLSQD